MVDVIVVGAGVGGLSAAIAAASEGRRVLIVEAAERAGGKAGTVTVDGVEVDTGPSVLTMPDVFASLLEMAGMKLERELRLREPSPGFRYRYPDGTDLDVYHALDDTLASVGRALGAPAARELRDFLDYAQRIWDAAAPNFVYGDAPSWRTVLGGGLRSLGQLTRVDPFSTMWGAIARRVRSPHLRMLLARYATYNGSDVRRAPATLNCIAHVELALGGFGVEGGMYELVRTLLRACARLGVTVLCNTRVRRILLDDGRAVGVELDNGKMCVADSVVVNADAGALPNLLSSDVDVGLRTNLQPSMSGWTAVVKARRRERVAHSVIFPENYLDEFEHIFDDDAPPAEPTVYLCAQSACHGRRGWDAHEPVFLMANAPPEPVEGGRDPKMWSDLMDRVLRRALAAGELDVSDRVLWRRTPTQLAQQFPGSRGAIYGWASNDKSAAFVRPPNRVPGVDGLFLASGSAHPGGGVPLAALSGIAAARALRRERDLKQAG